MDNTQEDPVENSDQQVNDINNDINNDVNNEMEIVPEPVDAPVTDQEAPSLIESPIEASNSENKMDVDAAPENSHDNKQQQQNITSNVDDNGNDNDDKDDKDDADDNEDVVTTKKTKMRYQTLIDSESEDENIKITQQSTHDSSSTDESDTETSSIKPKKVYKKFEVDSDTDEEDNTQINKENNLKNDNEVPVGLKNKSNKISDLIDSESEEDEEKRLSNYPVDDEPDDNTNKKLKKPKNQKKSNVTKRAAKDEAMKMIYSESQRLLRETEISLPYHRPKQRSLKEFLNRKKMDPILPEAGTMSARLKLSASIVSKIVEEKEKEAVIFFKSDSEDDDDDDHCESATQQINNDKETSQDLSQNNTEVSDKIEETVDKIETSDDNKVEKNSGDNGVSRKLFMDDDDDDNKELSASQDTSDKSADQDENKSPEKNQEDKPVPDDDKDLEKPVDPMSLDKINLDVISTNETTERIKLPDELSSSTDNKKSRDSLASQCSTDDLFASPISTEKTDIVLSSLDEASKKLSTTIEPSKNSFIKNRKSSIAKLPELKPKLRGSSGMMIDLTETVKPNKKAVNNLMDRYLTKHIVIQKQDDKKPSVSIINTVITSDGVEIKNDTVSYSANDKVEKIEDDDLNKPGVKLIRLKEELRKQMTIKRAEEWKQKEIEMKMNEEEDEEEEVDDEEKYKKYNKEKEIIINEDEEVVELESEPEENDIIIKDKKRKNREYDDDEAEVSDEEVELSDDEVEEEEEEEEAEKLEINDNDEDESGSDDDIDETTDIKKKKFSRIVNVDEDSDDDVDDLTIEKNKLPQDNKIESKKSDNNLINCEDDYPAPYQIPTDATQPSSVPFESPLRSLNLSSQLPISSPASTSLTPSIINSSPATQTQKLNVNSILESPKNISAEYYRIFGTQSNDKKKLFDNDRSQVTDDDLLALCSGKFTNSNTQNKPDLNGLVGTPLSKEATESQLLNICSGEFTSLTNNKVLTNNHIDDTSQDICLTLDESSQPEIENVNCTNSQINTQSLSLKLDNNTSTIVEEKNSPIDWKKFSVVSSEDEDDNVELTINKTKVLKKKKVLVLSDDEDDEDGKENDEEDEVEDEEEEEQIVESDDEKYIDYDSDENEIIISKKDINKVAKKYVDAEAELSDSDWDSADEDEKDLDKMEVEIGDNEVIDEDQMRKQIGKIHARQQLDDDQRRVTMLKEMFFDDGDLHEDGAGRERKFKWKNIDNIGMDNVLDKKNNEDDDNQDDIDDGVNEIEWRKLRMEREKFLQENKKIIEDDDVDLMKGKILKLGMRMIRKDNNTACAINDDDDGSNNVVHNNLVELKKSCSVKIPGILNKAKGSFLKRGDQELARLATVIKPTDSGFVRGNNKNFIFSHISPSVAGANKNNKDEDDNSDIEETSSKLNKIRKRKSTSGMTPTTSKKLKIDTNNLSKKKIF